MQFGKYLSIFLFITTLLFQPLFAESEVKDGPVSVSLVSEESAIQENHPFWVALHFNLEPHWHAYWKNPGDSGMPITIDWDLPEGFKADEVKWPAPKQFTLSGLTGLGFEDEVTLLAKITPPEKIETKEINLKATIKWVACNDQCIPGSAELSKEIPVSTNVPQKSEEVTELFKKARLSIPGKSETLLARANENELSLKLPFEKGSLKEAVFYSEEEGIIDLSQDQKLELTDNGYELKAKLAKSLIDRKEPLKGVVKASFSKADQEAIVDVVAPFNLDTKMEGLSTLLFALLAAFGGGMLLNLMPCVLPVLSLKVLSVVEASGGTFRGRLRQASAYLAGVVASFWALTSILLLFRASGEEMGWGFQLQEPIFVGVLACLMFLMALNFFGVFEFGTTLTALDGNQKAKSPIMGALWSGVLATIVATPCTGPFLGASLGFAMTLPPIGTFGLFTVMAVGMALPFFLLTLYPAFLKLLPKPGQWMLVLKQGMGFVLAFSVLWLIWVWEAQTSFTAVMWLLIGFIILSGGAWIYGQWGQPICSKLSRRVASISILGSILIALLLVTKASAIQDETTMQVEKGGWEHFSKARFQELKEQGKPIFVDFTAKWCLLCQANKVVMHSNEVESAFEKAGVTPLKADWTKGDPEITKMLKDLGRTGVPLYVIYHEGKTTILPETLNSDIIFDALASLDL